MNTESDTDRSDDAGASSAALCVALVDDDPMWRYLTGTALRERGWNVRDFDSGAELIASLANLRVDVVLLDAMMPVMDGFETCRQVRGLCGADPAVLMLTSLEDEQSIRTAYDAGANDFFIKSTHWSLLVERIRHLVGVAETARKLRRSDARLERVQNSVRAGSFDFDLRTRVLSGSAGSFCVLGYDSEQTRLHVSEFEKLIDAADLRLLQFAVRDACETRSGFSCAVRIRLSDGSLRRLQVDGHPETDATGRASAIHCVVCDLTEDLQARERIERMSQNDELTGLPNRNSFLAEADRAIEKAGRVDQRVAIAVIDLDRFTQINETLGQVAGDELLCRLGERIAQAIRIDSTGNPNAAESGIGASPLAARLTADEFAVMFPVVNSVAEVGECLDRIMREIQRPIEIAGAECFISASVGVALFPHDGDSAGILLSRADRATREVKARGRNGVGWYRPSPREDSRKRLEMVAGLHKALERGEFEVHYQPWIDVTSARVTGLEALLRWRRGERQVPPNDFIPLAEDTGLIVPIGEWLLQHVSAQLARWRRAGMSLDRIAINVPTVHFERESLLTALRAATQLNGLTPQSIELELTETCMVRDFEQTLPRLEALIDAGATLAIDDFGTGYSSLAYLTRLPIAKLKVDRAFVSQIDVTPQGGAVCRAIVALGRSLGVQVLAEGVETVEQARALLAIKCRAMQGFLFSRPVPALQVRESIADSEAIARSVVRMPRSAPDPGKRTTNSTS